MKTTTPKFKLRHGDPLNGALVPQTTAPLDLIDYMKGDTDRRLEFMASNCEKLADLMERVPKQNHNQDTFIEGDGQFPDNKNQHACGTVACGLGWAALSHVIPGLQYKFDNPLKPSFDSVTPTVNGEEASWGEAGYMFFGEDAFEETFMETSLSKEQLIENLREHACIYRSQL